MCHVAGHPLAIKISPSTCNQVLTARQRRDGTVPHHLLKLLPGITPVLMPLEQASHKADCEAKILMYVYGKDLNLIYRYMEPLLRV